MTWLAKVIATGFGAGYFPFGPGTAGAVVALLMVWAVESLMPPGNLNMMLVVWILAGTFSGVWATDHLEKEWGSDPSKVVMDEMIGQWIALLFIPFTPLNALLALILFRFFDILKPLGIRRLEAIKGGWGVMLDDVAAGVYANVVLQIVLLLLFF